MPYIPPEVIEQARQIDLLTYLQNCEPHELVRISGNNYTTRTHDSLKISNGKWMWWSQRIGGYNALDYLVKVRGFSFVEAVETLMGKAAVMPTLTVRPKQEEKPKTLLLPEKSKTTDKIREYLFSRGIDAAITDECIKKGVIFESLPYHNIVFVGFDEKQKPKYAAFRATNSRRILGDCSGSDKHYSFRLADSASSEVHLFDVSINTLLGSPRQLICQCCGMPLDDSTISKEPDGTFNEEYCKWCYTDGKFTYDNIDDLIAFCVEHMSNENWSAEQVRGYMADMLPKLNHWKTQEKIK